MCWLEITFTVCSQDLPADAGIGWVIGILAGTSIEEIDPLSFLLLSFYYSQHAFPKAASRC